MTEEPLNVKNNEGSDTQENLKKSLKEEAKKRRLELLGVVKKTGLKNAIEGVKTWAKHYEVSEVTIYADFKYIKKRYKPSKIEEIKIELSVARDQALQQSLEILSTPGKSDSERLEAIKVLIAASTHYREELEQWGEKPKVPDKLEYEGGDVIFQLVDMSDQEEKDEKEKHRKNITKDQEDEQGQQETNADPESPGR